MFNVLNTISSTASPLQYVIGAIGLTCAVGLTVIVNSFDGPRHSTPALVYVGFTTIIAVSVSVVSLIIC